MNAELPVLLQGMLPPEVPAVAVPLTKTLLRRQTARKKGDKALIDAAVESAWVTSLRFDTCGIPPAGEEYAELLVVCLRLSAAATPKQMSRLEEILLAAIPYPVFLIAAGDGFVRLSALPPHTPIADRVGLTLSAPAPEFTADLAVPQPEPEPNLRAVFDRWLCALYAQRLVLNPPKSVTAAPYRRLSSPAEAEALETQLNALRQQFAAARTGLKHAHNPADQIKYAKARRRAADEIAALLSTLNETL
ncbi:MAG: DUF4391 domain-containing protein [Akkermansia sp.]